jgi:hypothetical protein
MKNKELASDYLDTLQKFENVLDELKILSSDDYVDFSRNPTKLSLKQMKRNYKILSQAFREMIKRKELNIQ